MMKKLRLIYGLSLFLLASLLAACSEEERIDNTSGRGVASVTLRLGTANVNNHVTRDATSSSYSDWEDDYVTNNDRSEMMYSWRVIITQDGKIWKTFTQPEPTVPNDEAEIDVVVEDLEMPAGEYLAYSFANIGDENLKTMLSLANFDEGTALADATVTAAVATMNGNAFVPAPTSDLEPADNSLGGKGIPMSNKQTLTIPESSTPITKDLIVVRMLAKMELQFWNETGSDVTLESVTISDITGNVAANLKLLPNYGTSPDYPDDMDDHHQDIRPNLNGTPTTVDFTYTIPETNRALAQKTYAGNQNDPARKVAFYVNESTTPTNPEGLFYLTVKMKIGDKESDYRYALVSKQGKKKDGTADADDAWTYIARNDYRIIPVILDDYRLELIPYDFPPIGVYPCSVREIEDEIYEMTFHDYGHFHLVPKVTKVLDNSTVAYSADAAPTGTAWTLYGTWLGTTAECSLRTALTKGGEWVEDGNPLFGSETFYVTSSTATTDADDNGGVPVLDATTVWNGTSPFIFGKIAEPGEDWWNKDPDDASDPRPDRTIYNEFRVKLYVGGTYRRDLLYRFYMTLSADQMLGSRLRGPRPSCGLHHHE